MNNKSIVNLTNKIALAFVIILIYWVFIFSMMAVFDFKIFRQNMTEAFALSVLGIMAVLCGAVVINIMLNLTRIADKTQDASSSRFSFKWLAVFLLSFPLIFVLLYLGDFASKKKKERLMIAAAETLINDHPAIIKQLRQYRFERDYLFHAQENIRLLSKTDNHFPDIHVLTRDNIQQAPVILSVGSQYVNITTDDIEERVRKDPRYTPTPLQKIDFIYSTNTEERQYLFNVLDGKDNGIRYEAYRNSYKLYYPIQSKEGNMVILLSDYMSYGKLGS